MAGAIDKVKNALGAGARANKYRIFLTAPGGVSLDIVNADLLCKSATFPGVTVGQIETWNQGRKFIIPGDTAYTNTWTLTFYNTEDHKLRKQFIDWMRKIDNFQDNKHAANPGNFMTTMKVVQMLANGSEGVTYTFNYVFPQDIGEISVADDSSDTLQEFDVTLSFTDWVQTK